MASNGPATTKEIRHCSVSVAHATCASTSSTFQIFYKKETNFNKEYQSFILFLLYNFCTTQLDRL